MTLWFCILYTKRGMFLTMESTVLIRYIRSALGWWWVGRTVYSLYTVQRERKLRLHPYGFWKAQPQKMSIVVCCIVICLTSCRNRTDKVSDGEVMKDLLLCNISSMHNAVLKTWQKMVKYYESSPSGILLTKLREIEHCINNGICFRFVVSLYHIMISAEQWRLHSRLVIETNWQGPLDYHLQPIFTDLDTEVKNSASHSYARKMYRTELRVKQIVYRWHKKCSKRSAQRPRFGLSKLLDLAISWNLSGNYDIYCKAIDAEIPIGSRFLWLLNSRFVQYT